MPTVLSSAPPASSEAESLQRCVKRGHDVVCGVRRGVMVPVCRCVEADFTTDHAAAHWLPRLAGIDVVINAVGILRESSSASFQALHVDDPVVFPRLRRGAR